MKRIYIILLAIVFLAGAVVSFTQINKSINFNKEQKDTLTSTGISNPVISSCIKQDDFTCISNIYEQNGINKEIKVITKYCDEYENIYSDGDCLNWLDGDETECLEYETLETQGNCSVWKILTQIEIESELINKTDILLKSIAEIQENRIKTTEILTDEIIVEIKEIKGDILEVTK